jgi:hypothetical protein
MLFVVFFPVDCEEAGLGRESGVEEPVQGEGKIRFRVSVVCWVGNVSGRGDGSGWLLCGGTLGLATLDVWLKVRVQWYIGPGNRDRERGGCEGVGFASGRVILRTTSGERERGDR